MSIVRGCDGEVHILNETTGLWLAVGETKSWQMSESCTVHKRNNLGNGCRRKLRAKDKAWILSAAGYLDFSSPGQAHLRPGQKRRFRVYVSHHRDNYYYEGDALIHTQGRNGAADGDFARWAIAATGMDNLSAPGLVKLRVRAYPNGQIIQYPNGALLGAYQH